MSVENTVQIIDNHPLNKVKEANLYGMSSLWKMMTISTFPLQIQTPKIRHPTSSMTPHLQLPQNLHLLLTLCLTIHEEQDIRQSGSRGLYSTEGGVWYTHYQTWTCYSRLTELVSTLDLYDLYTLTPIIILPSLVTFTMCSTMCFTMCYLHF